MSTWTNVPNSSIETDKPVRAVDIRALRDNPIAIAGGAQGAPRIETNGINNLAVTTAKIANSNVTTVKLESSERMTTANVGGQTAGLGAGAVGSYAFAETDLGETLEFGSTVAGSTLKPSNAEGSFSSGNISGTWRLMGRAFGADATATSLWLRIS